jgi:predicted permease
LFLLQKTQASATQTWGISSAKLIIQPLIAWVVAGPVLDLPPLWLDAAVILSALPTGTGPFMLAQYYKADGSVISRVVLITTVGSLLTLSLFLLLNRGS